MRKPIRLRHAALLALVPACASAPSADVPWSQAELGRFHRQITTTSPEAQRWFDQGLVLVFGFDHAAAIGAFEHATDADPDCAMAWWGRALAAGPHINNPAMDDDATRAAVEAVGRARALEAGATAVERDLIEALSKRYVWPAPDARAELDHDYADAMREVWRAHRGDADVGTLFAEALMDLRPWDLWTADGQPQPGTEEVIETLQAVLALDPDHPGGCHYTIHTWEPSPTPERALPAADVLRARVPGASHLVHMPGHIDIRVGRYDEAILANQRAIAADMVRNERYGPGGFYAVYRAHNYHFLMWAAMFGGQSAVAMRAARDTVAQIPIEMVRELPQFLEAFLSAPYHVMVRFGRWEDMLREPEPDASLYGTVATWHYARGLACASLQRVDEARREVEAFRAAVARVPEDYTVGNNTTRSVLEIAGLMLEGEVEYRCGNHDHAFELLRAAVARDDALRYDEPWGWPQPARHALGALLLEQGHLAEAEEVYRADLARHPNNGWSLHGLTECLSSEGRAAEAEPFERALEDAWKHADVPLRASCFCRLSAVSG